MGVDPFLPIVESSQKARVAQISMLVNLVTRYLPLDRSCFPQAITARILLGLYHLPYCVYFGVRRKESGIDAHAWVFSGARCVCGGRRSFWRYRVLGVFVSPGLLSKHQESRPEPTD